MPQYEPHIWRSRVYSIEERRKILLNNIKDATPIAHQHVVIALAEEFYTIVDSFHSIAISLETLVKQGEAAAEMQRAWLNGTLPPRKEKPSGRNRKS
jgi:hypothetical protein